MWNERYAEKGFAYGTEPNDFLRERLSSGGLPRGRKALCLAEGEGRNAVWLAQQGWQVTAVDQSSVGLEKAQLLAQEKGVQITTEVADLAHYVISPFDLVVSIWAHVPPALRRRLHADVVRTLHPGGLFLLEAYDPANIGRGTGGPQDPILCMRLEDLKLELTGLEFEHAVTTERVVQEGKYHQGLSAVTQVVARQPVS